jgi:hypothetical protein
MSETVVRTPDALVVETEVEEVRYRVSWGAIFAGVAVALVVQALLSMLGAGIGIATLDPGTNDNPDAATFSIVAAIWWTVSGIIAAFAGGYVAARMVGRTSSSVGAFHGLTSWAFTTLLIIYLMTTAVGSVVGGAIGMVGSFVGGATNAVAEAVGPVVAEANPLDDIETRIRATGNDPEAMTNAAIAAMGRLVTAGPDTAEQARAEAVQALAAARGITPERATQEVTAMEENYRQAVETAQRTAAEVADTTASVAATGAIAAFVSLVLGGIAAWFGGKAGAWGRRLVG